MMRWFLPLGLLGLSMFSLPAQAVPFVQWDPLEQRVLELTNNQRAFAGLGQLTGDDRLQDAAYAHSLDMGTNDYFSHDSQDGTTFDERITTAGYNWTAAGENIAAGYTSAEAVMFGFASLSEISAFDVDTVGGDGFGSWDEVGQGWTDSNWEAWTTANGGGGWMGSTGHRANILNGAFTDLGVGYAFVGGSTYGEYWTQDFAAGDTAPVPAPAAVWLFAAGLAGLVGFLRSA